MGTQSTWERSKSFMSLAPNNGLFQVTKAHSNSKQYSSAINLAQAHIVDEGCINNKRLRTDYVNTSMKPPIHPPVGSTKFGISRKNERKHWSLDNGSKHKEGMESIQIKSKADTKGVIL